MYSWHQSVWQKLAGLYQSKQLHHALLFSGLRGIGKKEFALQFIEFMLCEKPNGTSSCQACSSCFLMKTDAHPDFLNIYVEDHETIKVESIRAIQHHANYSSHRNRCKIVLINPAEQMNHYAANALLKILEEPIQSNYFIILVTHAIEKLLPTVNSRLFKINFNGPSQEELFDFVKKQISSSDEDIFLAATLNSGQPLAILASLESEEPKQFRDFIKHLFVKEFQPIDLAREWSRKTNPYLKWWYILLSDLLKLKINKNLSSVDYHTISKEVEQGYLDVSNSKLIQCLNKVEYFLEKMNRNVTINSNLMHESILLEWQSIPN